MFRNRQSSWNRDTSLDLAFRPSIRRNMSSCFLTGFRVSDQHSMGNWDALRIPSHDGKLSTTGGAKRRSLIGGWAYGMPRKATIFWVRNIVIKNPIISPCSGIWMTGGSRPMAIEHICMQIAISSTPTEEPRILMNREWKQNNIPNSNQLILVWVAT